MTVYIVKTYDRIYGVYATKEIAEQAKENAQTEAEMCGSHALYGVEKYEVK